MSDDGEPSVEFLDQTRDWAARNERVRMLAERSLHHNDVEATIELKAALKRLVRPMSDMVPDNERDEMISALTFKAFTSLAHAVAMHADRPLSYVVTSLRNEFNETLRNLVRLRRREHRLPEVGGEVADKVAAAAIDDLHVRQLIRNFRSEAEESGSRTDVMVALVIEASYLTGLNAAEACDALAFTANEKKTITQKIAKQRTNTASKLCNLAAQVMDAPVRANVTRKRRINRPDGGSQ